MLSVAYIFGVTTLTVQPNVCILYAHLTVRCRLLGPFISVLALVLCVSLLYLLRCVRYLSFLFLLLLFFVFFSTYERVYRCLLEFRASQVANPNESESSSLSQSKCPKENGIILRYKHCFFFHFFVCFVCVRLPPQTLSFFQLCVVVEFFFSLSISF